MADMLKVANEYIDHGMAVFFMNYYKRPYKAEEGKMGGWHEGTTDKSEIKRLWDIPNRSNMNIAVVPAKSSIGFIIIDADRHAEDTDGVDELHELERKIGKLPDTVQALTPRKGEHRYFLTDADIITQKGFITGCDIIGKDSGFAVAPPSRTEHGEYCFEISFDECEIARLPKEWEEYILRSQAQCKRAISLNKLNTDEVIHYGQRYDYLVCRCAQLVKRIGDICTDDEIALLIMSMAKTRISQEPPIDFNELEKKMLYTIGYYRSKDAERDTVEVNDESGVTKWQSKIKKKQAWSQANGMAKSMKIRQLLTSNVQKTGR